MKTVKQPYKKIGDGNCSGEYVVIDSKGKIIGYYDDIQEALDYFNNRCREEGDPNYVKFVEVYERKF